MLWYLEGFQCAAIPLRANDTSGPVSASPSGKCGARATALATPGDIESLPLKIST